jgi:hypothetical protein
MEFNYKVQIKTMQEPFLEYAINYDCYLAFDSETMRWASSKTCKIMAPKQNEYIS